MRLLLQITTATLFLAIMATWLGSLRVVVVPAVSFAMHEGVALVHSGHDYQLLDSVPARCLRARSTDDECESAAVVELAPKVLFTLPFSRSLLDFTLSGLQPVAGSFDDFEMRS